MNTNKPLKDNIKTSAVEPDEMRSDFPWAVHELFTLGLEMSLCVTFLLSWVSHWYNSLHDVLWELNDIMILKDEKFLECMLDQYQRPPDG